MHGTDELPTFQKPLSLKARQSATDLAYTGRDISISSTSAEAPYTDDEDKQEVDEHFARSQDPSIDDCLAVAWKGNSDPFDSFSVPVTAKVFELIQFDRTHVHGVTQGLKVFLSPTNKVFLPTWWSHWSIMFSSSDISMLGYLSGIASIIGSSSSSADYSLLAVAFRTQAMARFRTKLAEPQDNAHYYYETFHSAMRLSLAELIAEDYQAAAMHLLMIKRVYHDSRRLTSVDLPSFFAVVFLDMQHATISCQRTVLDVAEGSWTEKQFKPFWQQAEAGLGHVRGDAAKGIDQCVIVCGLRSCFSQLREIYLTVEYLLQVPPQSGPGVWNAPGSEASNWLYVMSKTTFLMSRLNNQIIDSFESLPFSQKQAREQKAKCCARMVAIVAALIYTRRVSNIDVAPESVCASGRARKAGRGQIPKLCHALRLLQRYCSVADTSKYANLRLWALFVGAQHAEQARTANTATENDHWITREFVIHVQSMGIASWHECESYLRCFLFFRSLEPLPSPGWFERLLIESEPQSKPMNGPLTIRNWVHMGLEET